jgi:hypothetical protein
LKIQHKTVEGEQQRAAARVRRTARRDAGALASVVASLSRCLQANGLVLPDDVSRWLAERDAPEPGEPDTGTQRTDQ